MTIRKPAAAILVASLGAATVPAAGAAATVTTVSKAAKAGGSIFDDSKPQKAPRECYVSMIASGAGVDVMILTDAPFRAASEGDTVPGVGPRYLAIHFNIPPGVAQAAGGQTTEEHGYRIVASPDEKAAKAGFEGATNYAIKFVAEDNAIGRDTAEISLTREGVPLRVKVESLTKTASSNRASKLTCEAFTQTVIEPEKNPQDVFWESLRELCGKAYAHTQEPPVPTTPVLDVRKCEENSVFFGVHYLAAGAAGQPPSWNRSQTWVITKGADGLQMKYSKKESPAPEAKVGSWTAATTGAGNLEQQVFLPDEATVAATPALKNFGWAVSIQRPADGLARFTYQAIERQEAGEVVKGGYAFDIATPIPPPEEPPWILMP